MRPYIQNEEMKFEEIFSYWCSHHSWLTLL